MATPLTTVILNLVTILRDLNLVIILRDLNLVIILRDSSTGPCFIICEWIMEN